MNREIKDKYPEIYGYGSPYDIPGNENEITAYYLSFIDIDGDKRYAIVEKELFFWVRNYERNIEQRRDRETRCKVPSNRSGIKICTDDCDCCPYGYDKRKNYPQSLDFLYDTYELELADPSPGPEALLIKEQTEESLHKAIDMLDKDSRTIIYLYYWEDKTDDEIAKLLGSKRSTIQYERKRALGMLKSLLSDSLT